MKLPLMTTLLAVTVLFQGTLASADIRPHNPERGHEDRRDDRRDDRRGPGNYDDRHEDRYDHDRRDGRHGGVRPRPEPRPPVRPNPRPDPYPNPYPDRPHYPPHNNYGESSVQFYGVTRRSGGEWLRVQFNYPSYVDYVRVGVYRAGVQLHETYAITQSGRRIHVRGLSYTGTIYSGLTSEYLTAGERIVALDIRAESMGGNADLEVRVISNDGPPSIYPVRY